MRPGFHRVSRDPYMETVLSCPACVIRRREKEGVIIVHGHIQSVWYLGCQCPKPKGVL